MIPGPITSWSKNLLRYKTKPKVMDVAVADKTNLIREEKDGPSQSILLSACLGMLEVLVILLSGTPCLTGAHENLGLCSKTSVTKISYVVINNAKVEKLT
jgi:hypothetical protein